MSCGGALAEVARLLDLLAEEDVLLADAEATSGPRRSLMPQCVTM